MFTSILAVIFASAVIGAKPITKAIGKTIDHVEMVKEDKKARKEAMERYLESQIIDIEH